MLYFLPSTLVLTLYIDVVLSLSILIEESHWNRETHICIDELVHPCKPLPEPMSTYYHLDLEKHISVKFESKCNHFQSRK